jgi:hypothetical protein
MDLINDEYVEQIRNNAIAKYKENLIKKSKIKEVKEKVFLDSLKEVSDNFVSSLIQKSLKELQFCSDNGILKKKFYVDHFKNKKGCVKISTLVKGFKIKEEWNTEVFQKIGYESTPFQYAVDILKTKKILLEDISDINKGLSFWCQISFITDS